MAESLLDGYQQQEYSQCSNVASVSGIDSKMTENKGRGFSDLRILEQLNVRIIEARSLPVKQLGTGDRTIFCLVKMDREEIFQSSSVYRSVNPVFGDDFSREVPRSFRQLHFYVCEQYSGRVPRPFARVSLKKADVVKYSGEDVWLKLKPFSRQSEVTGKICLELSYEECLTSAPPDESAGLSQRVKLRVLDYSDLSLPSSGARPVDLYALVTLQTGGQRLQTQKLRIPHNQQRKAKQKLVDSSEHSTSGIEVDRPSSSDATDSAHSSRLFLDPPSLTLDMDPPPPNEAPGSTGRRGSNFFSAAFGSGQSHQIVGAEGPASPCRESDGRRTEEGSQLRISLWHDYFGSFSSYFHGEVRIPLKESSNVESAWYCLKPRNSNGSEKGDTVSNHSTDHLKSETGFLRLRLTYTVDHVLQTAAYGELWQLMMDSVVNGNSNGTLSGGNNFGESRWIPDRGSVTRFQLSPAGMLEYLPAIGLEQVARPLMKVEIHSDQLRKLVKLVATKEISHCEDVNTLFRSSSLTSKLIYELMKFVGHNYLLITLKPPIDKIYLEKKCCEIDPGRLEPHQSLEENTDNLVVYAEQLFSRVVDSNHRCPQILKDVFGDLRDITNHFYPGQMDVQRLVLSSFIILRFFSAAIMNPKHFGLKRDNSDQNVARTLALVSKILQRLSNHVVCGHKLNSKEWWMEGVLERFTDEQHKLSMTKFLDRISCVGGENSISGDSVSILKEGTLTQRFPRQKRCLELSWLTQKRRFFRLTEIDLLWGKNANDSSKGRLMLSEISIVQPVEEERFRTRNVFRVGNHSQTLFLQANNSVEVNDWVASIQKQCRRQRLIQRESVGMSQLYEIDLDRELETLHLLFLQHAETLRQWKNALDGVAPLDVQSPQIPAELLEGPPPSPSYFTASLYSDYHHTMTPTASTSSHGKMHGNGVHDTAESQANGLGATRNGNERERVLSYWIGRVLGCVLELERRHQEAVDRHLKQVKYGSKDNPIGDDNYLLLKSRAKGFGLWNEAESTAEAKRSGGSGEVENS